MDPDKLDRLARLLDGFDDEAAAEARERADELRKYGIDTEPEED